MESEELVRSLRQIVGEEDATSDLVELTCYSRDASENIGRPDAVVWPKTVEEVSRILLLANDKGVAVVPRGAGTSLSGSPIPVKGGIVMDLTKMDMVLEISLDDSYCLVETGLVWARLNTLLNKKGFFFPPDPASGEACTIGGCIAHNAGGVRAVKYGTTREWVLGLEVVLPTGEIINTGARTRKSVSGYDLTRLFVGSEGTLGVITKARLRIAPLPQRRLVLIGFFASSARAGKAVSKVMMRGLNPSGAELLDSVVMEAVAKYSGLSFPASGAMILLEVDGSEQEVSDRSRAAEKIFLEEGATEVKAATDLQESERLWQARKAALPALSSIAPTVVIEDATVPVSKIPEMLTHIEKISKEEGVRIATFGHAGDGNLHPNILFDERDSLQFERFRRASERIFQAAIELGGTLTGEHGIGLSKARFIRLEHTESAIKVMRRIKRGLDPNNIMNPGKMGLW